MKVLNTRPLSVLKQSKFIMAGDRIFHPMLSDYFCTVFKIVNRDHRGRVQRSLYVRLANDPLNRVAFVSIDAENKIETAARFSNNS